MSNRTYSNIHLEPHAFESLINLPWKGNRCQVNNSHWHARVQREYARWKTLEGMSDT